ncbi:MAG: hypothetical protein ACRDZP_06620 [Acidimicrobiales bacterium]
MAMTSSALVERTSRWLDSKISRRSFLLRTTFAASALAVVPVDYVLRPGTAYEAFCSESQCGSSNCSCGSTCCEGFSTFCCSINRGYNFCPEGTLLGGWWAAADSSYCGNGTRYYLDCNAHCHCTAGCGGGWPFCDRGTCDGQTCHCAGDNCNNWVSGCYQFRYGQCNQHVPCFGAIVCRVVSCTPPYELNINCDSTWMVDDSTAEMNAPCNTRNLNPPPPPVPPCDSKTTKCETIALEDMPRGGGYWLATSFGKVLPFGTATFHGDKSATKLTKPIVAMRRTPTGLGYWLAGAAGNCYQFGDAHFHGSAAHVRLSKPVVGMATMPLGDGYWLVGADGRVFTFGSAKFHGSLVGTKLAAPVVGMESTSTGNGYWLVAEDGGIFSFGDATFHGAPASAHPHNPVVALRRSSGGAGYYVLGSEGALWVYGDAKNDGDLYGKVKTWKAVDVALSPGGRGYWITESDGAISCYGQAKPHGGGT